ncbi:RIP metalloprotease, partial [bacterium]
PLYMANGVPRPSMIVGTTDPSYGAGAAGVRVKDELVSVNGKPVAKFYDLRSELDRNGEKPLDLGLLRNGKPLTLRAVPKLSPTPQPVVGADGASTGETKRLPLLGIMFIARLVPVTLPAAVGESFNVALAAGANVTKIFTQPKTAKDNVGGVITMARATDQMVGEGFQEVMGLAALLSISIGIFNLLPIPPLDGGQMLLTIIEMVRGGRRPSLRLQGALVTIGGVLLITMFLGVFILDISRVVQERKAKSETVSGAPAKSIPVVPAKPEKSP